MSALLAGLFATSGQASKENGVAVGGKEKNDPAEIIKEDPVCDAPSNMTDGDQTAQLEGNRRWYIRKAINLSVPVIITPESFNQALAIEDSNKLAVKVDGKISAILAGNPPSPPPNILSCR